MRTTSGCIRLYPEDIRSLYNHITIGTHVKIIHDPYKIGIYNKQLYLEVHEPLSDPYYNKESNEIVIKKAINNSLTFHNININDYLHWSYLEEILQKFTKIANGYPLLINNVHKLTILHKEQLAENKLITTNNKNI